MISRRHWSVIVIFLTTTVLLADAQQPPKLAKIGYVASAGTAKNDGSFTALREGMRDLGYSEVKISFLTTEARTESRSASPHLCPNSCNSK
jgi:hypothetical protein